MAVLLAVLIPVLMLGVVLALGRYEELLLPAAEPAPDAPVAPVAPDLVPVPVPGEELPTAA
ncbi:MULTISPECIES: hypothetical protein [Streptomyces]|jgi:hypothetical protein|uniref:Uncharacterized protein n=2 Tax=Streptomyces TaxID=1883 RepID=A0ABT9LNT1_STRGD|nr:MULTISPECIES: hypothetical protein [Streptomyces]MDP9685184.1 hypothetical protein [Streptomyces griseoviridis]GGS95317.1 hypothetical protein GCM10010240_30850 [Streptomyces griseoviridis]GGU32260.1 hypothetical protein GCM10010259_23510 [Streptomyces daghestanicus]GHI29731.1 hypothetical protein Sdagh_14610 [Streptomyces daghestanicus]GHI32081.1 hypothetical protein Sdagh_38110 [Streptomyces daghestanicus]